MKPRRLFPVTPESSGVYQILNTVNGRRYIGMTRNLRSRWLGHYTSLNRGAHHNKYLQEDWNEYGPNVFEFSRIPSEEISKRREREIIKELQTDDLRFGYNQDRVYITPRQPKPVSGKKLISRLIWLELAA